MVWVLKNEFENGQAPSFGFIMENVKVFVTEVDFNYEWVNLNGPPCISWTSHLIIFIYSASKLIAG